MIKSGLLSLLLGLLASAAVLAQESPAPKPKAKSQAGAASTKKKDGGNAKTSKSSTDDSSKKSAAGTTSATEKKAPAPEESAPPSSPKSDASESSGKKMDATTPKAADAAPDANAPTSAPEPDKPEKKLAAVSTLLPEEIAGFDSYPAELQNVIRKSLELTTKNLRYQFGSSDPSAGGMDCSGTIFRVLTDSGIKDVPRQSDEFCRWVMKRTTLYRTEEAVDLKGSTFSALKPGDLLFWTGTYETSTPRELPISHVMIYLGTRKKDGKPVIFGASDGRTYDHERRNGVSVFDFSLPKAGGKSTFYGYGPVPGLAKK